MLIRSIGEHEVIVPKSRDMGGTWVPLFVIEWLWQFFDGQSILMGSSKQDYVDKAGDDKCLFWRLEYFWRMLPSWLRPPMRAKIDRKLNMFGNPVNGSAVTGEATNPNFGRGSRPGIILLDEFASVDFADEVLSATGEATNTRWIISTFFGAFGAFYKKFEQKREHAPHHIFSMHWSKHPDKRKGLYTSKPKGDKYVLEILDKDYEFPTDYKFTLDGRLRSVFRDYYEFHVAGSKQEVAQQLDMEPQESGWQFISTQRCEELCLTQARQPTHRGTFVFNDCMADPIAWKEDHEGPVQLWVNLTTTNKYAGIHDCGSGSDLSYGMGGKEGSNSATGFYSSITKEKVCQITTGTMPPHVYARFVVAASRFLAGPNGPALIGWEDTGPGQTFRAELFELKYQRIWYPGDPRRTDGPKSGIPGYKANGDAKRSLLDNYKAALLEDRVINRCREAIMECSEYVRQPNGKVEHVKSLQPEDRTAVGELHGDMVIADALAYLVIQDLPGYTDVVQPDIPENSWAGRRQRYLDQKNNKSGSW